MLWTNFNVFDGVLGASGRSTSEMINLLCSVQVVKISIHQQLAITL